MPIETDLSNFPYWDDYDPQKDYYRMLFRPGMAVQVRELNQLQRYLQAQVERLGQHNFKSGTIVDGVNLNFFSYFPYAKLKDNSLEGEAVDPADFEGLFAKTEASGIANLTAFVVKSEPGFEAQDPDLNTIYLKYNNSGTTQAANSFAAGEILKFYDGNNSIFAVDVVDGSSLFSNTDQLIIMSAIAVQNSTGGTDFGTPFTAGQTVTQSTTGANAVILETNNTVNSTAIVLKLRPVTSDISNNTPNSSVWTFETGYTVTEQSANATVANTVGIIGASATGSITTDGAGVITTVEVDTQGSGYYVAPHVTAQSPTGSHASLDLTGRNYKNRVEIASVAGAVGTGYALGVSEGIIFQRGHLLRVDPQTIVVEKYSNLPDDKVVGFSSEESIISSTQDATLLDNSTGELNDRAPGANRLKIVPTLEVRSSDDADDDGGFLTIAEFSDGLPYKQATTTQYNVLGEELARRTFEESGDYVVDPFLVTTRSPSNSQIESSKLSVVVDPGLAYVQGYRAVTNTNAVVNVDQATSTKEITNNDRTFAFGKYVRVNEFAGVFEFQEGQELSLRDTAADFLSGGGTGTITAPGAEIGTARVRSVVFESGIQGDDDAVYRMYLYNIRMNVGLNFRDVRAIFYNNGSQDAIADIVLTADATLSANVAKLEGEESQLLFYTGHEATSVVNSVGYVYRSVNTSLTTNTSAQVQLDVSAASETFPYTTSAALTDDEKSEITYMPLANAEAAANVSGSIATTSGQSNATGTSTTFATDYEPGDYVKFANSTVDEVHRVESITNNTLMTINGTFAGTFTGANSNLFFPKFVPVDLTTHSRVANVNGTGDVLTIDLNETLSGTVSTAIHYNGQISGKLGSYNSKTAQRNVYVKIDIDNNDAGLIGPWCIGHPDVFRLKGVWQGTSSGVTESDTEVTQHFYVDHNQNPDYYGLGYLYKRPTSNLTISAGDWLLVKVDLFTTSATDGFFTVSSYSRDDAGIANTGNTDSASIHTLEIPEMVSAQGKYFDLINYVDFRPLPSNTAARSATTGGATSNPAETLTFSTASDFKFPAPGKVFSANYTSYLPRVDRVVIDRLSNIRVIQGNSTDDDLQPPVEPENALTLNYVIVPPYPSLPISPSGNMAKIIDRKVNNEKSLTRRQSMHTASVPYSTNRVAQLQPRNYKMADIGKLEKRIRDLEYYVNLNQLEVLVKDKVIPSSISPSINRFKYGFFVDDYSTVRFTELASPEYNASIVNEAVHPASDSINIEFEYNLEDATTLAAVSGCKATMPYNEIDLANQLSATDGAITSDPLPTPNTSPVEQCSARHGFNGIARTDNVTYTLSSSSGTGTLYFNNYSAYDEILIKQGNTTIASSNDAVVASNTDILKMRDFSVFSRLSISNARDVQVAANGYARYVGKIDFTHNASNGRDYTVTLTRGGGSVIWDYVFCYPVDDSSVTTQPSPQANNVKQIIYNGTMTVTPSTFTLLKTVGASHSTGAANSTPAVPTTSATQSTSNSVTQAQQLYGTYFDLSSLNLVF